MKGVLKDSEDHQRLKAFCAAESDALQRDRYRAVLLAVDDQEGDEIADRPGRVTKRTIPRPSSSSKNNPPFCSEGERRDRSAWRQGPRLLHGPGRVAQK
jgi:hypothetical protein